MKILISSTYFSPYSSGLSVYAHRIAAGLHGLGHEVVVLTSQHKPDLPREENMDGFTIVRVPVTMRVSKGVIMPGLKKTAREWIKWADVVNLHLPQFESAMLSRLTKRARKPLLITHHCDLVMQGGWFNRLAGWGTSWLGEKAVRRADLIVQNSLDYARYSPVLKKFWEKVVAIPTPVNAYSIPAGEVEVFKRKYNIQPRERVLGLAGRVASEKGYEYLAKALPEVLKAHTEARVIHAGSWKGVLGEEAYQAQVEGLIAPLGDKWMSLGFLSDAEFNAFFAACDLLIFYSTNATESFGIVQIEAMTQGTPVLAADLPGIRQPVRKTGLGRIVPPCDARALAQGIIAMLDEPRRERVIPEAYLASFTQQHVAQEYEKYFIRLTEK